MTYQPRSQWEYGDPVFDQIAAEEHADHTKAKARGLRLRALTEAIVSALVAPALLPGASQASARVAIYGVLADHLYGLHALDVPELRKGEDV